jgi:hypothetical protein
MSGLTRRAADGVESGGWIMHAFSFGKIGEASVRPDSIVDSMNPRQLRGVVERFYADVWNLQAPAFYERLGFVKVADIVDYPKGHAKFILVKKLDPPSDGQ